MANHNQSSIPELPKRRGEVAQEARLRFAAELQEAFTLALPVLSSRFPDAHYAPSTITERQPSSSAQEFMDTQAEERQPHSASYADRLRQTVPFNPTHVEAATPYPSDSQGITGGQDMEHAAYINNLVEQPDADTRVLQEQAKNEALDQVYAAYREDAGLPPQAEGPVSTELNMTPLQRAERDFPNDDRYLVGDIDVTMGDIRGAVNEAFEPQPPEEQQS